MLRLLLHTKKRFKSFVLFAAMLFGLYGAGYGQASQTFNSSGTFTVPSGVTSVTVECWGGGGAGGGQNSNRDGAGGGGGGAYSKKNTITVTPGLGYSVVVGLGGTGVAGGTGGSGGDSYFINTSTVLAKGGSGGSPSTGTPPPGGLGGAASSGVGDVKYSGGQGEAGRDNNTGRGGYGGSSAGTAANGWSGPQTWSTLIYPTANTPTGGGHGGDGGNTGSNGATASTPGGGGGGSGEGGNMVGGNGGGGRVKISWTPIVTFTSASQSSASESGTMTITAQLSAISSQNVTIPFTVTGTATGGGTDYTITSSPITITAGSTTSTITITIASDASDENDETVIVTMGTPTNANKGATTVHTATITDDDPPPTVSFTSASQASASETGTMTVTAQLSVVSGKTVTVPFTLSGTATGGGTDYSISSSPLTISAGNSSANITITIATDAITEGNETVIVTMGTPTNATQGATTVHTATITDDDVPTVTFTSASQSSVGESGTMTITAQLSETSPANVSVPFTLSGTASGGGIDYSISSSPLTINSGATSANITITIQTDATDEEDETVIVTMGSPTNAAQGATTVHTATITDDDDPPTVTLSSSTSNIIENGGTATITATLGDISGKDVTVNLAFSGTATGSGTDYSASGSQIVISAGDSDGAITLTAVDDSYYEGGNETIIVDISSVTNGTENGTQQETVNIIEDENPPTVTLSASPSIITENGGVSTVTATLSNYTTENVTVYFSFSGTATGGGTDYTASASQVAINSGSLTNSFTITAVDDAALVGDISVVVDISSVTNASEFGTQQETITIADDESAPFGSIAVDRSAPENTYTPQELVENVLVTGCLTASNITFTGNSAQIGHFTSGSSSFPLAEGIILSTGNVSDAEGPNYDYNTTTQYGGSGDSDLNTEAGLSSSFDAAILEFDFVPAGDVIEFNYVFASEEYAEFVGEQYNDAFAFFLSGPGITGTENIALIPGTSTPVAINNVHGQGATLVSGYPAGLQAEMNYPSSWGHSYSGSGPWTISPTSNAGQPPAYSSYYVDNGHFTDRTDGSLTWANGNGSSEMEYDGRTTVLTATHAVTACSTYHIKIVVVDAVDQKWDSGVFLEGRSFTSNEVQISSQIEGISGDAEDMYEGCDGSFIRFQRAAGADNSEVLNFPIIISGTATNGVDFVYTNSSGTIIGDGTFPTSATLNSGVDYIDYYYKAQSDGVIEGNETVLFRVNNSCPCDVTPTYFETLVTIIDVPQIVTSTTEVIQCQASGNPVATITVNMENGLNVNDYTFSLDGGTAQASNVFTITATLPDGSDIVGTSHYITVSDQYSCNSVTEYNIIIPDIAEFAASAGDDITICEGESGTQLNASGGIYYEWTCSPAGGTSYLSSTSVSNPTVLNTIPAGTYTFTVTAQDQLGASPACQGTDDMVLTVNTRPGVTATADDYAVCSGTAIQLNASVTDGGSSPTYSWNPTAGLSDPNISNPVYTTSTGTYLSQSFTVTVTADNGCPTTASTSVIEVFPDPVITTSSITNASCSSSSDGSATVSATSPGTSPAPTFTYQWDAAAGSQTGATATGLAPGTYVVTVTDNTQGCSDTHQVTIGTDPDTTDPTAVCQNASVTLDGTGNATISTGDIDNGSTDDCTSQGNLILSLDKTTFNTGDVGTNNVTLTVEDEAGNTSTCNATVTVNYPATCIISGSTTIWLEDFSGYADNTTDDTDGLPNDWSTSITDASRISVQSGQMRATNTDQVVTWLSEPTNSIDISGWTNLNISVDLPTSSGVDAGEYIQLEYNVDGSGWTQFDNNGYLDGNYSTLQSCTSVPNGSLLQIRISISNNRTNEFHYFDNVHLTGDPDITITPVATDITCNGLTDGIITVSASGAFTPYQYKLDAVYTSYQSSNVFSNLPAGTYTVTVKGTHSTILVEKDGDPVTVVEPAADPVLQQLAVSDATSCNPAESDITFTVSSAQNGVTYELQTTGGASLSPVVSAVGSGSDLSLTILQANVPTTTTTYRVFATSSTGCSDLALTDQPTLTVYNTAAPTGSASQSFCSSATPRISDISVTGSNIIWYNAASGGSVLSSSTLLVNGNSYYASQTVNGCESQDRLAVSVTVISTPTILTVTHGTVCGTGTSTIYATASSGTINWYSAQTGGSLLGTGSSYTTPTLSTPGKVSYWVESLNNGCVTPTRSEVYVNVYVLPAITLGSDPIVCKGTTSTDLTYSGTAGTPSQYMIDFDGTAEGFGFADVAYTSLPSSPISITVPGGALAGTYNAVLRVKNTTNGCISNDYPITITVVEVTISDSITDVTCSGFSNGAIDITVSGGTGPYTFAWTTSDGGGLTPTDEDQTGLEEGTYDVTVTDANSCQASGSYTVSNVPDNVDPEISFSDPLDDIIIAITSSDVATDVSVNFTAFDDGRGARNVNPVPTDNCTVNTFTYVQTGATTVSSPVSGINTIATQSFNLGETVITWDATDVSANAATSKTQKVYAARANQFILSCASDADLGCNPASFPITNPTYSLPGWLTTLIGNSTLTMDTVMTTTLNAASGTECDVTRTRTYTVTFNIKYGGTTIASVTRSCTQTYTYVIDTENPVPTCTTNQAVNTDSGECNYTHSGTSWDATATDNCNVASITYALTGATTGSGSSLDAVDFNAGVTTVTWTATDDCGNSDQCSYTVTVSENLSISVQPQNATVCNGDNTSFSVTASGTSGTITYQWQVDTGGGFGDVTNGGVYSGATTATLVLTSPTLGMSGYQYRVVITGACSVDELTSSSASLTMNNVPTISVSGSSDPATCGGAGQIDLTFTNVPDGSYTINYDGGSFNSVSVSSGSATISSVAVGTYNNLSITVSGCTSTDDPDVTISDYVDNVPPTLSNCPTGTLQFPPDVGLCSAVIDTTDWDESPVVSASDNCDPSPEIYFVRGDAVTGSGKNSFPVGTTEITLYAKDSDGNISTGCTFYVLVSESTPPTINCPANDTVFCFDNRPASYADLSAFISAGGSVSDNADGIGCGIENSSFTLSDTSYVGNILTRTYEISDYSGNSSTCDHTIVIDQPTVTISSDTENTCPGDAFTITSTVTGYSGNVYYQWETRPDGLSSWTVVTDSINSSLHGTLTDLGEQYRLKVAGTNDFGTPACIAYSNEIEFVDVTDPVWINTGSGEFITILDGGPGTYSYTVCSAGSTTISELALDALDVADNCDAFGDLTITKTISSSTTSGDASSYSFPIGTTTVTYDIYDSSGNQLTITFDVIVNSAPTLTTISHQVVGGSSGSGTSPYQCGEYNYYVDSSTPEGGFTYAWSIWEGTDTSPSTGTEITVNTDYTLDNSNSPYNAASVKVGWDNDLSPGTYTIKIIKSGGNGCDTEETLEVSLQNNFNAYMTDLGNECQSGPSGTTTGSWQIDKTCGATNWSFDYIIFEDLNEDGIKDTGETIVIPVSGTGAQHYDAVAETSITIQYNVTNSVGIHRTYTLIISNVVDSNGLSENSTGDNTDSMTLYGVPNTTIIGN